MSKTVCECGCVVWLHQEDGCEGCGCTHTDRSVQATATGFRAPRTRALGEALRAAMATADDDWWSMDLLDRGARGPELDAVEMDKVEARLRALGVGVK